ncbi:MAG: hypothetical protein A2144_10690 [Chloroflexi bacterium RBG_16_50_9]|nr:MAG: hypothetical protein A2144_10690 [Chloroflexi bacterium RBG_16_50_9]
MQKASSKPGFNVNRKVCKTGVSLPEKERLDKDMQDFVSSGGEQPMTNDFKGRVVTGTQLRGLEDEYELPDREDVTTKKQEKPTISDTIFVLWHELLSPLTLIKGYAATLLQLNNAITEGEKEQYLRGIDSASNRIVKLLENLRDVTQLEERDTIFAQTVSVLDLLREVLPDVQNQTPKHNIKLSPYAPLPRIKVDPEKIEQVIRNLLGNAAKYSPQGGDIEVELRTVRTDLELMAIFGDTPPVNLPSLIVSVADNGMGVPETELERIFEKFYRVDRKVTGAIPGAGLGLYICKIIVEAHGGHIWARNRRQGGSIFSFSLPVNRSKSWKALGQGLWNRKCS